MATQNKDLARQLLLARPQLSKALFQVPTYLSSFKHREDPPYLACFTSSLFSFPFLYNIIFIITTSYIDEILPYVTLMILLSMCVNLLNIVMQCISSLSLSLVVTGEKQEKVFRASHDMNKI